MWYVLARLSISSNRQRLHNSSCSLKYMSNNWCHFQQFPWEIGSECAERVGQVEVGWTKGENSIAVCAFGCKSLSMVIALMVISPHRPSKQSSSTVCYLERLALPQQLDHKSVHNTVQSHMQSGAYIEGLVTVTSWMNECTLSTLSIHSPMYSRSW